MTMRMVPPFAMYIVRYVVEIAYGTRELHSLLHAHV